MRGTTYRFSGTFRQSTNRNAPLILGPSIDLFMIFQLPLLPSARWKTSSFQKIKRTHSARSRLTTPGACDLPVITSVLPSPSTFTFSVNFCSLIIAIARRQAESVVESGKAIKLPSANVSCRSGPRTPGTFLEFCHAVLVSHSLAGLLISSRVSRNKWQNKLLGLR